MAEAIERRVVALERRVAQLERLLDDAGISSPELERPADLETTVGLTWLNRIGAIVLVAALALAVAWANDRGYLTPVMRNVLLALASTIVLIVGAWLLRGHDVWRRRFAIGVAVVGASGLFLVPLSASRIDTLITSDQAAALAVLLTLALVTTGSLLHIAPLVSLGLIGGLTIAVAADGGVAFYGGPALVAALYVSFALRGRTMLVTDHAAIVVATAVGVVIAYDTWTYPSTPALAGASMGAAAAALYRRRSDPHATRLLFVVSVVLVGVGWTLAAARIAGTGPGASVRVSVGLVLYGVALVGIGVARTNRLCRLLGVAALACALAKLVGHDVWRLGDGLRVAGLTAIGAGLLVASFLYTRYAASE